MSLKKIIVLLFICGSHFGYAQYVSEEDSIPVEHMFPRDADNQIRFRDTIPFGSLEKHGVYAKVKSWISKNYKSSRTIQEEDSIAGKITLKSIFIVNSEEAEPVGGVKYFIDFTINEQFVVIDIYGFLHSDHSNTYGSGGRLELYVPNCKPSDLSMKIWKSIKRQTYNFTIDLQKQLEKELLL